MKISVYWYYKTCSFEYYGDLLSDKAKSKLEKRLLRKPDLSLDDLYLNDANPLLANLGQQSREFTELLRAHDIDVYNFEANEFIEIKQNNTFLAILQRDIHQIKYRVASEYRLTKDHGFYIDPINAQIDEDNTSIYDLPNKQLSININVCHNKMREVQVMFNEIVSLLNKNNDVKLDNILICAPNIEDYSSYISAVFDNEFAQKLDGKLYKLPYSLIKKQQGFKPLLSLKLIINAPYELTVSYLIEILSQNEVQQRLDIDINELELIKQWLKDNAINFGYNESDYSNYGYEDYSIHSFKQFLMNLVLGVCLTEDMLINDNNTLPIYKNNGQIFTPYDNLDYTQVNLCNKLIKLIVQLESFRNIFYVNKNEYKEFTIEYMHLVLTNICDDLLTLDDSLSCEIFLGYLLKVPQESTIILPILNLIFDEYMLDNSMKVNFNGKISCASMQSIRNIPYDYIYILGMNFGEFPTTYNPNQLSLLAKDWALADRNYNLEDKQIFLDTILATGEQLYISYIGRKENDNSEIKPSTVISILMNTIGQSFTNFVEKNDKFALTFNFKNMVKVQSLHPFYNNKQVNFSTIWRDLTFKLNTDMNLRWDFKNNIDIELTGEQKKMFYAPKLKDICNTFLYTNTNLYKALNINIFDNDIELDDYENLVFINQNLTKAIFAYFEKYFIKSNIVDLMHYLITKGVLSYANMGEMQFNYYKELYENYINFRGKTANISLDYQGKVNLCINDMVWMDGDKIIILDDFTKVKDKKLVMKFSEVSYHLRVRALIICALIHNGALINNEICITMQVVIRQINAENEVKDIIVDIANKDVLDDIMNIYLYSITNPLLIHKKSIIKYVDEEKNHTTKAFDAYNEDYANYDLDKLKNDIIYATVANEYFEFVAENNIQNDIFILGDILANLKAI